MPRKVIRKGTKALEGLGGGSSDFVSIGDGDAVDMAPLVDMEELISIDQHAIWLDGGNSPMFPCIGEDEGCPGCASGNQARFRAFLPVLVVARNGEKVGEVKIFSHGVTVARSLEELDAEFGGLTGRVVRVKRRGVGLSTKYTVIPLGKKVNVSKFEVPDVEEKVGPTDKAGIVALLKETGALDDGSVDLDDIDLDEEIEEEEEEEEPKPATKKRKPRAKKAEPEPETEEEEEEVEDWEDL